MLHQPPWRLLDECNDDARWLFEPVARRVAPVLHCPQSVSYICSDQSTTGTTSTPRFSTVVGHFVILPYVAPSFPHTLGKADISSFVHSRVCAKAITVSVAYFDANFVAETWKCGSRRWNMRFLVLYHGQVRCFLHERPREIPCARSTAEYPNTWIQYEKPHNQAPETTFVNFSDEVRIKGEHGDCCRLGKLTGVHQGAQICLAKLWIDGNVRS